MSDAAKSIMTARQHGASIIKVMRVVTNSTKMLEPSWAGWMKPLVIEAFKQPRFSTPEHQQQAITDFENSFYLTCYEAARDKK